MATQEYVFHLPKTWKHDSRSKSNVQISLRSGFLLASQCKIPCGLYPRGKTELSFLLLGWISPFYLRTTFQSSGLQLISSSLLSSPFFLPLTSQPMKVGTPRWKCLGQTPGIGKGLDLFRAVFIALQNHWKLTGIRKLTLNRLRGKPIAMGERGTQWEVGGSKPERKFSRGSGFCFFFQV